MPNEGISGVPAFLAQWIRATGFYPVGQGFESSSGRETWVSSIMESAAGFYPDSSRFDSEEAHHGRVTETGKPV